MRLRFALLAASLLLASLPGCVVVPARGYYHPYYGPDYHRGWDGDRDWHGGWGDRH